MKALKGWARYRPCGDRISRDILATTSASRLMSLARRVQVLETAIRNMNHKNGMFLDRGMPVLYSLEKMLEIKTKLRLKQELREQDQ